MTDERLDRILASEETLIPSSGFTATVMDRIREEAAAPPPIPFPWKRVLPGVVVAGAGLVWGAVELTRLAMAAAHDSQSVTLPVWSSAMPSMESLGWVALALAVSATSWFVTRRFGGESGLL